MSDFSTSIIPVISDYPNRKNKAKEIIEWLISLDAVKPVKSDCILSITGLGYPISDGAKKITDEPEFLPYSLINNGLEVVDERTVFDAGENGLDNIICPKCKNDIVGEEWDFRNYNDTGVSILICPACNQGSELNEYLFEPQWGFSNLGFTFWNWPDLKKDVIKEFEKRLGCKVNIVFSHV